MKKKILALCSVGFISSTVMAEDQQAVVPGDYEILRCEKDVEGEKHHIQLSLHVGPDNRPTHVTLTGFTRTGGLHLRKVPIKAIDNYIRFESVFTYVQIDKVSIQPDGDSRTIRFTLHDGVFQGALYYGRVFDEFSDREDCHEYNIRSVLWKLEI